MKMVRSVAKSVKTHTIGHLDAEVTLHSILTFVRTIFPGVWEVSVMRHGGQASDEIEDDLYQYNII